jgi:hypothetical protein
MKLDILVPIFVILGCIILIVIKTNNQENFKSEKRESPMFLPIPEPTFISNSENKKDLIIVNEDNNNNFPMNKYELKIDPPKPYDGPIKPDQPFKDVNFIRDNGVTNAMNKNIETDNKDYTSVINSNLQFKYPTNSNNYLKSVDIKNISKEELDNSTLFDIYDKMSVKVVNNISKEQIDSITGKPIDYNEANLDLYKPILTLIDQNLEINSLDNEINYKYKPYVKPINGSLL